MIRAAFLSPSLGLGGAEMFIRTLARSLQTIKPVGFCHLGSIVDPWMREEIRRIMPIYHQRGGSIKDPREVEPVQQCVEKACEHADVLISWGFAALGLVTENLDIPVVEVSHGSYEWADNVRLLEKSCGGATHCVGVSETARKAFPEAVRDTAEVIYNGVELDRVTPIIGRNRQRELWGIEPEHRVALYLGRFCPHKGPQRLIAAAEHLMPEWRVILVGDGPTKNDAFTNVITENPPENVQFFPTVYHVGDALAAADVIVMPSKCEGMPLGMVEAWLAGVPVVSFDHAWQKESESLHGNLTFNVSFRDAAAMQDDRLFSRPIAKEIEAAGNRVQVDDTPSRVAKKHYTATAMAQRWEQYLTRIVREWEDRGRKNPVKTPVKPEDNGISPVFPGINAGAAPAGRKPAKLRIGMFPYRIGGRWLEDVYNTYLHHAEASGIEYVLDSTDAVDAILVDFRRVKSMEINDPQIPVIVEQSQGGPRGICPPYDEHISTIRHCLWRWEHYQRTHLGLGFGALTRLQSLREADASGERPIGVSFVGTTTYTNKTTHEHRQSMLMCCNGLVKHKTEIVGRDKEAGNKLPMTVPEYFQSLLRAKIALSPLGLGDCCHRDYEAIMAGCVMVGPDRDDIEAWPDIYRSGEMYIRCAKDHSDLPEIVDSILSNWAAYDDWRRGNRAWLIEETQPWRVARRIRRTFEKCLDRSN